MITRVTRRLITVLFVLVVLLGAFLLYSTVISWNLFSVIVFWFFIVPALSHFSAKIMTRKRGNLATAINGCLLFYTTVGVLIYFNYETSFLRLILMSLIPAMVIIYLLNEKEVNLNS
ncbi:hypothetical protein ACE01N_06840 [Saccharicrinis sp. FJH2]|uniref:hypothetical protein n=1 Tax=unclassified Saccharicrinis TaxID=2646859 RepID=UPI0035D4386C